VDGSIFTGIDKSFVLVDLILEPLPDLTFEVGLASQSESLATELFDCIEGGPILLVPRQPEAILKHVPLNKVILLISDGP